MVKHAARRIAPAAWQWDLAVAAWVLEQGLIHQTLARDPVQGEDIVRACGVPRYIGRQSPFPQDLGYLK